MSVVMANIIGSILVVFVIVVFVFVGYCLYSNRTPEGYVSISDT